MSAMSENSNLGAAGPAIAAHSKDGSVPGPTPASSATGDQGDAQAEAQQAYDQAVDQGRDFAAENPVGLLLAVAGVGLVLGLIVARR
jgi:hypothetical protein